MAVLTTVASRAPSVMPRRRPAVMARRRGRLTDINQSSVRILNSSFLYGSIHETAGLRVRPGAGVLIAVKHYVRAEGAHAGDRVVLHVDHRRVADPSHRHRDRDNDVARVAHADGEAPEIVADLFHGGDVVPIG